MTADDNGLSLSQHSWSHRGRPLCPPLVLVALLLSSATALAQPLSQRILRALSEQSPFALAVAGVHTSMPILSARNGFMYDSLKPLAAMGLDCRSQPWTDLGMDEYYCASYIGSTQDLVAEWTRPSAYSVGRIADWFADESDTSTVHAGYFIDNGLLVLLAVRLPQGFGAGSTQVSIVVGLWRACSGKVGTEFDLTAWSNAEKQAASECANK